MASDTTPNVRRANPEFAQAMREIGRSNAARPHVPKPHKGSRAERDRAAIRDQRGA